MRYFHVPVVKSSCTCPHFLRMRNTFHTKVPIEKAYVTVCPSKESSHIMKDYCHVSLSVPAFGFFLLQYSHKCLRSFLSYIIGMILSTSVHLRAKPLVNCGPEWDGFMQTPTLQHVTITKCKVNRTLFMFSGTTYFPSKTTTK